MDELQTAVLAYLAKHHVLTLATVGADGVWAAAVFYVNQQFDFYFLSAGHTRHGRHLGSVARVAATIQADYADWQAIQGVQLEGRVTLLQGDEQATAVALYKQKFPFLQQADASMQTAMTKVNWYHLQAERLYFIDNSKGLGHREQVTLPN